MFPAMALRPGASRTDGSDQNRKQKDHEQRTEYSWRTLHPTTSYVVHKNTCRNPTASAPMPRRCFSGFTDRMLGENLVEFRNDA